MSGTHTGNSQPSIDKEEHRSVNGVDAKAVFPYSLPTYTERYDVNGTTIYVGQALPGAAESDAAWTITKYILSDITAGTGKLSSTTASWTNRALETYK